MEVSSSAEPAHEPAAAAPPHQPPPPQPISAATVSHEAVALPTELAYASPVQRKPSMVTAIGVLDLVGVAVGLLMTVGLGFMIAGLGFAFQAGGTVPAPVTTAQNQTARGASDEEATLLIERLDQRLALTATEKDQFKVALQRGHVPFTWDAVNGFTAEQIDNEILGTSSGETGGTPTKTYSLLYGDVVFEDGGVNVTSYAGRGYSDVTVNADGTVDVSNFGTNSVFTTTAAATTPSYLAPAITLGTGLALNAALIVLLGIVGIGMLRGAGWARKYQRVWAYAKMVSAFLIALGIGWLFYRFFNAIGGPAVGVGFVGIFYGVVFLVAGLTYPVGVLIAMRGWDVRQYFSAPTALR